MSTMERVAIIGSGPAGLATALALLSSSSGAHDAHSQRTIELWDAASPAEYFDTSVGAAVQITPNGMAALHAISAAVCQAVLQEASHVQGHVMILPNNNNNNHNNSSTHHSQPEQQPQQQPQQQQSLLDAYTLQPLPPDPPSSTFPTVMIRWGIFRKLLLDAVMALSEHQQQQGVPGTPTCQLRLQHQVTGFSAVSAQQVCLEYYSTTGNNDTGNKVTQSISEPYSLVIAADGKESVFRSTPLESSNSSSPRVNFKAVVQSPQHAVSSSSSSSMALNEMTRMLPNMAHTTYSWLPGQNSHSIPCFVGPAGAEGWFYWGVAVPRELAVQFPPERTLWKSQLLQLLFSSFSSSSLSSSSSQPLCPSIYRDLIAATPETAIYRQESTQAAIPAQLIVAPNIVLVGDAAHAMNASYGQATSFALEDAATLAYCLSGSTSSTTTTSSSSSGCRNALAERLDEYSRRRVHRCLEMQQKSQQRLAMTMKGQDTSHITQWIHHFRVPTARQAVVLEPEEKKQEPNFGASSSVPVASSAKSDEDEDEDQMIVVVA